MSDSSGNLDRILAKATATPPEGGLTRTSSKKKSHRQPGEHTMERAPNSLQNDRQSMSQSLHC